MAIPEHLEILKQGVDVWNEWRKKNQFKRADLTDSNLSGKDLSYVNFSNTDLYKANLSNTTLLGADFTRADLPFTILIESTIVKAEFTDTFIYCSNLKGASFAETSFNLCWIENADFSQADLDETSVFMTTFKDCIFTETNFHQTKISRVVFADCDLSPAIGLAQVNHESPSTIGIDSIYKSGGKIPEVFLRKIGIPETFITYAKSLIDNPIDFYSCFISFTEKDDAFSERLYNDMQAKGVRCWRWKEDAKWGRSLRKEIDAAVRYYDKLVVICSKDSLNSPAVLEEIERALDKEERLVRDLNRPRVSN